MEQRILRGGMPLLPSSVAQLLPDSVLDAVGKTVSETVEEVHLRAGGVAWLTAGGRNVALPVSLSRDDLSHILLAACGGSLYAHADTIRNGFLTLSDGVRVGVIGHAVLEAGATVNVRDVSALCFRIPTSAWVDPSPLVDLLYESSLTRGLLLFSPPGGGKTTALRALVRALGSGANPRRVAVVDTRCELAPSLGAVGLCVDVLSGYPRGQGIEIAVRSMGAQIVVCDELCGVEDAETVLALQGGGVPLVATAHAADIRGLLTRSDMRLLHEAGTFGVYVHVDWRREKIFDAVRRDAIDGVTYEPVDL